MEQKWRDRFMQLAGQVGEWSKQERKVGAVVVTSERKLNGAGYNGPPPEYNDATLNNESSTFMVIHAEVNALQNSEGSSLTLFVTSQPCLACAAAIVASKRVSEVVMPPVGNPGRWAEAQQAAIKHLISHGIKVQYNG
jgi:deoxycytidylate deaminase